MESNEDRVPDHLTEMIRKGIPDYTTKSNKDRGSGPINKTQTERTVPEYSMKLNRILGS